MLDNPGVASEWIGLAGVVLGGAIGSISTYLTSKRSSDQVERVASAGNQNQRTMAREAREQDRLAGAYVGLLALTERIGQWAEQVNPMYRPDPDRPLPDLDKQADVVGAVRAYGSDEVIEAFEAWQKVIADMRAFAQQIAREPDAAEPRESLRDLKPREVEKHKALVRQINKELRPRTRAAG
jgi:hypothetical protein